MCFKCLILTCSFPCFPGNALFCFSWNWILTFGLLSTSDTFVGSFVLASSPMVGQLRSTLVCQLSKLLHVYCWIFFWLRILENQQKVILKLQAKLLAVWLRVWVCCNLVLSKLFRRSLSCQLKFRPISKWKNASYGLRSLGNRTKNHNKNPWT